MTCTPLTLPYLSRGDLLRSQCVKWKTVLHGSLVQASSWTCLHDCEEMRAERWQRDFTIKLIQHGTCRVHDGAWSGTLDAATAVVQRGGAVYRTTHPFGFGDTGWTFAFDPVTAAELLDRAGLTPSRWPRPMLLLPSQPAGMVLRQLILLLRCESNLPVDPIVVESLCLELFESLLRAAPKRPKRPCRASTDAAHHKLVERTREYLHTHLHEPFRLDRLTEAVASSPAHLCRVFKRQTGTSIGDHVRRLRVGAVFHELVSGDQPLYRVARHAGYCNQAHLTSSFHRAVGFSPRVARRHATFGRLPDYGRRSG